MKDTPDFSEVLKKGGYKATPGRILLLRTLWREARPVDVAYLEGVLKGALDKVTLYRALGSLVNAGILRQIDFRHGHAHYELNALREHHHHIVCTDCGSVEDTECSTDSMAKSIAKKSKKFASVTDHSVEFFGTCNSCAKI